MHSFSVYRVRLSRVTNLGASLRKLTDVPFRCLDYSFPGAVRISEIVVTGIIPEVHTHTASK